MNSLELSDCFFVERAIRAAGAKIISSTIGRDHSVGDILYDMDGERFHITLSFAEPDLEPEDQIPF